MDCWLSTESPMMTLSGTLDDLFLVAMDIVEDNAVENIHSSKVKKLIRDLTVAKEPLQEYVKYLEARLQEMQLEHKFLHKKLSELRKEERMLLEARNADNQPAGTPASTLSTSPNGGYERKSLMERPDSASIDHSHIPEDGESLWHLRLLASLVEELRERRVLDNDYRVEGAPLLSQHATGPVIPSFGQAESNWLGRMRSIERSEEILNNDMLPTIEQDMGTEAVDNYREEV
ncbi:hypothetical protein HPB51_004277 [Rhipicephalus microplus]|uniref:Uncharacterized protein n=1 Tax=Rhipicephalus microplus TaxID=6941 RepID=A0A9J6EF95_RHIMP|nr:hypothetical protein HPB51_004277 [Rhipicephalus microplus]